MPHKVAYYCWNYEEQRIGGRSLRIGKLSQGGNRRKIPSGWDLWWGG